MICIPDTYSYGNNCIYQQTDIYQDPFCVNVTMSADDTFHDPFNHVINHN